MTLRKPVNLAMHPSISHECRCLQMADDCLLDERCEIIVLDERCGTVMHDMHAPECIWSLGAKLSMQAMQIECIALIAEASK